MVEGGCLSNSIRASQLWLKIRFKTELSVKQNKAIGNYLYPKGAEQIQTTWEALGHPHVLFLFFGYKLFSNNYKYAPVHIMYSLLYPVACKRTSLPTGSLFIASYIP